MPGVARADPDSPARKGWDVWGETCTQYFFIDETFLERLQNFEAGNYVYTPPPRPKRNQEILWNAVRTNDLQAISTDHCAYTKEQKLLGKDDFRAIPNGAVGMENRLQMIHHFGVREGRISLNRMVDLLCTTPAKLFGMYPKKGTLAIGSDGDVVVFDPDRPFTISASTHHSACDINIFEGTEVRGVPETVLRRGEVIVENGELLAKAGSGQFVRRAHFGDELKTRALAGA